MFFWRSTSSTHIKQALSSLPSLLDYLQYRSITYYSNPSFANEDEIPQLNITENLLSLVIDLNEMKSISRALRPSSILHALSDGGDSRRLLCYEQQDAHELFQLISQNLTKEEGPLIRNATSLFDPRVLIPKVQPLTPVADIFSNGFRLQTDDVSRIGGGVNTLKSPLKGLFAQRITCYKCGYSTPIRHQPFDNISLTMPHTSNTSIDSLLRAYMAPESLQDWICARCSLNATVTRIHTRIINSRAAIDDMSDRLKKLRAKAKRHERDQAESIAEVSSSSESAISLGDIVLSFESDGGNGKLGTYMEKAIALEIKVRREIERLVQMVRDKEIVEAAAKFDPEMTLISSPTPPPLSP
ncbi:hypothetical protein HK096_004630 [Nowakowskiella sp. JEL0078]|nr:hypothetical protein HK096_004630 [Nowakowskiella sp. JEL0078]